MSPCSLHPKDGKQSKPEDTNIKLNDTSENTNIETNHKQTTTEDETPKYSRYGRQ
jgi:hypothetical protein